MSELIPAGSNARMTKAQIKKYIKDMRKAQELAKQKLKEAENNGDIEKEELELKKIEKELENIGIFIY